MGILNVTPDSFFDGGQLYKNGVLNQDMVMARAEKMIEEGADIIDIGGESTRPGSLPLDSDEELKRILPVIHLLKSSFNTAVSVDTYKAKVAKAAVEAGADIINDIGMMEMDPDMVKVIGIYNVKYVLTHNKANYVNLIDDLLKKAKEAQAKGVRKENIILDPGIGFNKTYEDNVREMRSLKDLCDTGYEVLLGTSRKSFIGRALEEIKVTNPEDRLFGTIATTVMAVMAGVSYVRVHDVAPNREAICVAEAILRSKI